MSFLINWMRGEKLWEALSTKIHFVWLVFFAFQFKIDTFFLTKLHDYHKWKLKMMSLQLVLPYYTEQWVFLVCHKIVLEKKQYKKSTLLLWCLGARCNQQAIFNRLKKLCLISFRLGKHQFCSYCADEISQT